MLRLYKTIKTIGIIINGKSFEDPCLLDKTLQESDYIEETCLIEEIDMIVAIPPGGDQACGLHLPDGLIGGTLIQPECTFREWRPQFLLGQPLGQCKDVLIGQRGEDIELRILGDHHRAPARKTDVFARALLFFHDWKWDSSQKNMADTDYRPTVFMFSIASNIDAHARVFIYPN